MLKEFRQFIMRGNVLDLAIAKGVTYSLCRVGDPLKAPGRVIWEIPDQW